MKSGSPVASSNVKFALLFVACAVLLMSLWLVTDRASAQEDGVDGDDGAAQDQYSENNGDQSSDDANTPDVGCERPRELQTFEGPQSQRTDTFQITGGTFRIRYETTVTDPDGFSFLDVDVLDEEGSPIGEGFLVFDSEDGSRNILVGPGTFSLAIDAEDIDYTVIVDDCLNSDNNQAGDNDNDQTNNDPQNDVITTTIPDKILVNTGGEMASSETPIMAALLGAAALFGVFGAAMLRLGRRRG